MLIDWVHESPMPQDTAALTLRTTQLEKPELAFV